MRLLDKAGRLLIEPEVMSYFTIQFENGSAGAVKNTLQEITKRYREGWVFPDHYVNRFELDILGAFTRYRDDAKVTRWTLNALARMGSFGGCRYAIASVLSDNESDPSNVAAAIAAVRKLHKNPGEYLKSFDLDPILISLASLQHAEARDIDLSCLPLSIENADPEHLKLGLILLGLGRAPARLFHPAINNKKMLRELTPYPHPVVSQYSVWAVTENPKLSPRDISLKVDDISSFPTNVRSWVGRAIAMHRETAIRQWSHLRYLADDQEQEIRLGVAVGLQKTFFDGISGFMENWLGDEKDFEVSTAIYYHMVINCGQSPTYQALLLGVYSDQNKLVDRKRMEALSVDTPLYQEFKLRKETRQAELILNVGTLNFMGNNSQNNSGTVNTGIYSNKGDATVHGNITNSSITSIGAARAALENLDHEISASNLRDDDRMRLLQEIRDAKADPTEPKLNRVIATVGALAASANSLINLSGPVGAAVASLASAIGSGLGG